MKEIIKVKVSENPENINDIYLVLLSKDDEEIMKINIERLTGDNMIEELNSYNKYKKSIWDICGDFIKEKNPKSYVIEKEINKEFFGHFLTDNGNFSTRPSDGIIIAFALDIPVYLGNELYKLDEVVEEDINELIKKAVAEENYELAKELKLKRDSK
jgi:bifunctional DNase/RNase